MDIPTNSARLECPRCGSFSCEQNGDELFCPNCLYHEFDSSLLEGGSLALVTPSSAQESAIDDQPETLGELIEQIPSDLSAWNLYLTEERTLRMTAQIQHETFTQDNDSRTQDDFAEANVSKREAAPYDLMAYPDDFKGTGWIRHGVAWPTRDGKRLKVKIFMDKELPANGKLLLVASLRSSAAQVEDRNF